MTNPHLIAFESVILIQFEDQCFIEIFTQMSIHFESQTLSHSLRVIHFESSSDHHPAQLHYEFQSKKTVIPLEVFRYKLTVLVKSCISLESRMQLTKMIFPNSTIFIEKKKEEIRYGETNITATNISSYILTCSKDNIQC